MVLEDREALAKAKAEYIVNQQLNAITFEDIQSMHFTNLSQVTK